MDKLNVAKKKSYYPVASPYWFLFYVLGFLYFIGIPKTAKIMKIYFLKPRKKFCYVINDFNKLHYLLEIVEGNYESGNQQLIADYQNIANKMNFQLSILKSYL